MTGGDRCGYVNPLLSSEYRPCHLPQGHDADRRVREHKHLVATGDTAPDLCRNHSKYGRCGLPRGHRSQPGDLGHDIPIGGNTVFRWDPKQPHLAGYVSAEASA